MIDLHMHSIYSDDGQFTPQELAEQCGTITNEILSRLGSRLPRIPKEAP